MRHLRRRDAQLELRPRSVRTSVSPGGQSSPVTVGQRDVVSISSSSASTNRLFHRVPLVADTAARIAFVRTSRRHRRAPTSTARDVARSTDDPDALSRRWRAVATEGFLGVDGSWMGACPGNEESAGVNYSHRCPKGNRQMRRVLNQAANAAVKAKGTIFSVVYRRIVPRLGHAQAIGAITHRLCRLIWKILHERVRYEERGPAVSVEAKKVRARKMIRELRGLGYRVELISPAPSA